MRQKEITMSATIIPERVAKLPAIHLRAGSGPAPKRGKVDGCAMQDVTLRDRAASQPTLWEAA